VRPETYASLAQRERTYWWHRARRRLARSLLHRYGLAPGCQWLDIGCGSGGNFATLAPLNPGRTVGLDISPIALSFARKNAPFAELVESDVNEPLPFPDADFDVVTIFNVLYHQWVKHEASILAEVARVLRPGGLLLLTEPAFSVLERAMDDAVMTRRRYQRKDFNAWLHEAALEAVFSSYFTSFGVPILLAAKLFGRLIANRPNLSPPMDMQRLPAALNESLFYTAIFEGWLLARGFRPPFGTTLVLVARRRGS
jgi:ubiquinone/menaquinone biosynthesis C-methylase UbiE